MLGNICGFQGTHWRGGWQARLKYVQILLCYKDQSGGLQLPVLRSLIIDLPHFSFSMYLQCHPYIGWFILAINSNLLRSTLQMTKWPKNPPYFLWITGFLVNIFVPNNASATLRLMKKDDSQLPVKISSFSWLSWNFSTSVTGCINNPKYTDVFGISIRGFSSSKAYYFFTFPQFFS